MMDGQTDGLATTILHSAMHVYYCTVMLTRDKNRPQSKIQMVLETRDSETFGMGISVSAIVT